MSVSEYVLIDDESDHVVGSLVAGLNRANDDLRVTRRHPLAFEEQVEALSANGEHYGVLLDERLDQEPVDAQGTLRRYRGTSVAQAIRVRDAEPGDWERWAFPIILLSFRQRMAPWFDPEVSTHELFDLCVEKETIVDRASLTGRRLCSLATGYSALRAYRRKGVSLEELLAVPQGYAVDPLVRQRLLPTLACSAVAQFLLRQVIGRPGLLVDEATMAARLGVDSAASPGWMWLVKNELQPTAFAGVFADGWQRWWAGGLERWWKARIPDAPPLRLLDATERVKLLQQHVVEALVAAVPEVPGYRSRFWTVCVESGRALDPADGVRIAELSEPEPWQLPRFMSLHTAVEGFPQHEVHPFEAERVQELQEQA